MKILIFRKINAEFFSILTFSNSQITFYIIIFEHFNKILKEIYSKLIKILGFNIKGKLN